MVDMRRDHEGRMRKRAEMALALIFQQPETVRGKTVPVRESVSAHRMPDRTAPIARDGDKMLRIVVRGVFAVHEQPAIAVAGARLLGARLHAQLQHGGIQGRRLRLRFLHVRDDSRKALATARSSFRHISGERELAVEACADLVAFGNRDPEPVLREVEPIPP